MSQRGRRVNIALIVVCQSTQGLALGGIALFIPLIRSDIAMTFSQAGTLAASSLLVYAAMQVPSGYLADRFGARRLFLIGLLGANTTSLALAVMQTYGSLLVNQALSGFFRSLVFAPGLVLITSQFPTRRRATAMGLYVAGGFSTNIVLNALGPVLVGPLGWRALFAIFSIVGLVIIGLYWWIGEAGPRPEPSATRSRGRQLVGLLRHRVLWLAGAVQFVRLAVVQALRFWLPTYIVTDKGLSLQFAGLLVALGAIVTAPSNLLGGYVSDRRQQPLLVVGASLAVLAISFVLLVHVDQTPLLVGVVVLQSVFVQAYFGPLFDVPIRQLGAGVAGTVNGFGNFWANVGGLTIAYVLGVVKDTTGSFAAGWYGVSALCVAGLVVTAAMARSATQEHTVTDRSGT